jgi:hypothetical protein
VPQSKPAADAGPTTLTDEEFADLQAYYAQKIRAQRKKAVVAKAAYDLELVEVNCLFKLVTAVLKATRKEFEAFLSAQDLTEVEFLAAEAKRNRLYFNGGLPVGAQQSLFEVRDTVDDKIVARADGKRAYLRGEEPTPPDYIASVMVQDWLAGWTEEQGRTIERMGRAEALIEARGKPSTDEPADLNGSTDNVLEPGSPEELKATARARESLDAIGEKKSAPKPKLAAVGGDTKVVRATADNQAAA